MLDLRAQAAPFVGAPYRLLGRDPAGWDCWGCVRWLRGHLVGRESPCWGAAYSLEDTLDFGLPAKAEALIAARLAAWARQDQPAAGQVVLLEVFERAAHVGFMLNDRDFIHAWEGVNTVMAATTDNRWHDRVLGFYDT